MKVQYDVIIYFDGNFYDCYIFDNIVPFIEFLDSFYFEHNNELDHIQVHVESYNLCEDLKYE